MTAVRLYRNPDSSESADEWDSLVTALCEDPRTIHDELIANGEVLAVAFDPTTLGSRGPRCLATQKGLGWSVTPIGVARLAHENR